MNNFSSICRESSIYTLISWLHSSEVLARLASSHKMSYNTIKGMVAYYVFYKAPKASSDDLKLIGIDRVTFWTGHSVDTGRYNIRLLDGHKVYIKRIKA